MTIKEYQFSKSNCICVVGDFCLSAEKVQTELMNTLVDPWSNLRSALADDIAIIANVEGPYTNEETGFPYKWANLKTSPELHWTLNGLAMAVLGNNHILDFGTQGLNETKTLLDCKGIASVGYGDSLAAALKPTFIKLNENFLGVVSLCCPTTNGENLATHLTAGVAPLGMATLKQAIKNAQPHCDALIVYLHWGREWVHDPAPDQLRMARHAIECGADAVIGCHSHTIQSYEQYRGRWIFYGLGNFLFKAGYGQAVRQNGEIEYIPIKLDPPNRESLAVSFRILPRNDNRLEINRIQPMRFGDDLVPIPISASDLTFDLNAANARLKDYVTRNEMTLCDRSEPVFLSKLHNGVLAYWYRDESINPHPKRVFKKLRNKAYQGLKATIKRTSNRVLSNT